MNGPQNTSCGIIEDIKADGHGPASGQIQIVLKDYDPHFFVWIGAGKGKFLDLLRVAFEAMWDAKNVEISWKPRNGDQEILDIRRVG